ncbi:MAG: hypothetical protein AAF378_01195 [Cyanobacteria bacterium P01_A01_bin.84]
MQREQNVALLPKPDSQNFAELTDNSPNLVVALLNHYSFDLGGYSASELVTRWQREFPVAWLRLAIIEALYQGRYKAISVQQILAMWQRRGHSSYHFNLEFETLICSKLPEDFTSPTKISLLPLPQNYPNQKVNTAPQPNHKRIVKKGLELRNQQTDATPIRFSEHEKAHQKSYNPSKHTPQGTEIKTEIRTDPEKSQLVPKNSPQHQKFLPSTQAFLSAYRKFQSLSQKPTLTSSEKDLINSESSISEKLAKFTSPKINHPPIGQFTPDKSDRSESFTCKLKAIAEDEV